MYMFFLYVCMHNIIYAVLLYRNSNLIFPADILSENTLFQM